MTIITPTYAKTHDAVDWDSDHLLAVTDILTCLGDADLTTVCTQVGKDPDDILRIEVPGLAAAGPQSTIKFWWTARNNVPQIAILPYNGVATVSTTNKITVGGAPGNSPFTASLSEAWLAEVYDLGSAKGAFRFTENNASPIAGNWSITEVEVNLVAPSAAYLERFEHTPAPNTLLRM